MAKASRQVQRRKKKPLKEAGIALRAGMALGRHEVGKHSLHTMGEGQLQWSRREDMIEQEAK